MLLVVLTLVLVGTVPLFGGRLSRLAGVRLRLAWLLFVSLAAQVLVISVVPAANHRALAIAHVTSYLLVGVVVVANRRLPGVAVAGLGGALNGVTIALNGGTLPASATALARAGQKIDPHDFTNSGVLTHPRLPWLGDVLSTPGWFPLHNVFSVGDVVLILGAAWAVHALTGSRLAPGHRLAAVAGQTSARPPAGSVSPVAT
jgi:hypothetical protein